MAFLESGGPETFPKRCFKTMASNLFTKKSAQSIFAAVEAYAAARGYSPREATDLRHQLTPRMITFAGGQVVGKRVVRIKH